MKQMDDKAIASAMSQAMDFTYQTGKFLGKEGGFNRFAASFIDTFWYYSWDQHLFLFQDT